MKKREINIHILCWIIIIFLPIFFYGQDEGVRAYAERFLRSFGGPLSYVVVFYFNYLWLVPKHFFSVEKSGKRDFVLWNIPLIILAIIINSIWWRLMLRFFPIPAQYHTNYWLAPYFFHATLMLVLITTLSIALRMMQRWQLMEQRRKEAEQLRIEAELSNLRHQLNPHFLLNTLNNIYSLIAIDSGKAQDAVQELSRLLRHMLYDDRNGTVPLYKEVEFIRDYISLMKIRLTDNVTVDTKLNISPQDATPIAPLIFISLIENAFKHGISPTEKSFISVEINNQNGVVSCRISNTNFPKSSDDLGGSGIGLKQLDRRLKMLYPGKYSWTHGVSPDGTTHQSSITINT